VPVARRGAQLRRRQRHNLADAEPLGGRRGEGRQRAHGLASRTMEYSGACGRRRGVRHEMGLKKPELWEKSLRSNFSVPISEVSTIPQDTRCVLHERRIHAVAGKRIVAIDFREEPPQVAMLGGREGQHLGDAQRFNLHWETMRAGARQDRMRETGSKTTTRGARADGARPGPQRGSPRVR